MLKKFNYEKFTIEQVQSLIKSGYFSELICDADNKTIGIKEEEYIEAEKHITEIANDIVKSIKPTIEKIAESLIEVSKTIGEICVTAYNGVKDTVNRLYCSMYPLMNKKISKKKFIKLLQSNGIQRNEINKIIQGNKEKYTYLRYYTIVNNLYKNNKIKNDRT